MKMRNHSKRTVPICLRVVLFAFLFSLGCGKEEKIRRITVDADRSGIEIVEDSSEPSDRMVVAIHETPSQTWTFKVSGSIEDVDATYEQVTQFFQQVTFDEKDQPSWELPEGWSDVPVQPGPFSPFAKLKIQPGLQMSISKLPAGFDMLSNINRWHGQLSLPPTDTVDLKPIADPSKTPFQVFDQVGRIGRGGMRGPGMAQPQTPKTSDRMVVAIHETSDQTWTFKIAGPANDVNETEEQWTQFFQQITFDEGGMPSWKLPTGWSDVAVNPGPFSPFAKIQVKPGLQMSISKLPPDFDQLLNVNRWHRQLSIPSTQEVDLNPIAKPTKTPFLMFDELGSMEGGGMKPPFAGMGGAGAGSSGMAGHPPLEPSTTTLDFTAPEGWEAGKTSQMVAARFSKVDGEATAQITVSRLPARLNSWERVARNWAGELNQKSITDDELNERIRDITIDSLPGKYVRLVFDAEDANRATIGIRVVRENDAWFIKLTGAKKLVVDGEVAFDDFVKSIRFK